jgi:glycosyltransferase involved in cell wall biosynthesis
MSDVMTPLRLLVGLTEYAQVTSYTGGIGRHYASLLPALVRAGAEVDLVLFDDAPLLASTAPSGVRLVAHRRLRGVPEVLRPLVRAADFRAIAASGRHTRILVPEWGGLAALLPSGAPLVTNLATSMRLSNEVAGLDVRALPLGRRAIVAVQDRLETRQIRRSGGVVPISRAMAERNTALLGPLPPAVVVRNCIDVAEVRRAARDDGPLPAGWPQGDGPVVLFLGRLERRKGVVEAAEALGRVARAHDDARFVFAGAPGDRRFEPTVDALTALVDAPGRTTFLGHVPGDELYRAIRRAAVVVCPSRWEGFGQAALEAKTLGRPLVATSGSGYDDFCTDGVDSLLVAPGDPAALADAVCRILVDPALATRLGTAAHDGAGRFTADAVAPALLAALERLG